MNNNYFKLPIMFRINRTYQIIISILFTGIVSTSQHCFGMGNEERPFLTSSVGNFVWDDVDRDGKQDFGERGISGVDVVLFDASNQVLSTVRTDASGHYSFSGLNTEPVGKGYHILFKLLPGYLFASHNSNFSDAENSDADEATGKTNLFILLPGQINNDIDAGFVGFNGTLPLHRLNLHTVLISNYVQVTWEAENELNTTIFIVQRSNNGVNFTDITSKPPSGPVNTPTTYQVNDNLIGLTNPSCLYYRIKAMDNNGRIAYSKITIIKFSNTITPFLWPIPFVDLVNLSYNASVSSRLQVIITNASGKIMKQLNVDVNPGLNQVLLKDLDRLSAGLYFIRIYDQNTNEVYTQKISK